MQKEIIITILVITLVVIGNIITQNNTKHTVEVLSHQLGMIRQEAIKEEANQEELKKQLEQIEQTWKERYKILAYYIEHEELEKVETEITKLRANIATKEYQTAVESIDTCNFILMHINEKSALKIVNVF